MKHLHSLILEIFNQRMLQNTRKIWKNSLFFIVFEFFNFFLPIYICLIAANLTSTGAYAVMGIGFVTSFQLAYTQSGLNFAIFGHEYILKRQKNQLPWSNQIKQLTDHILLMALIYGLIITPLYVAPAYVYTKYANAHINTIDSLSPAYQYIYGSSIFVLLTTIASAFIINLKIRGRSKQALVQMIMMFCWMIFFSSILGLCTSLKAFGLGLGLSIGTILTILSSFFINNVRLIGFRWRQWRFSKMVLKNIFLYTWRPVAIVLSIQILKGVALLSLNYQIPYKLVNVVPLNYQMARILWYNMIYFVTFFIIGFTDSIYFYFAQETNFKNDQNVKTAVEVSFIFCAIIGIMIIIACTFLIHPLANEYVKNQQHTYDPNNPVFRQNIAEATKSEITSQIKTSIYLNSKQKEELIYLLNTQYADNLSQIVGFILQTYFSKFNAQSITNLIIFPHSFTYFYCGIYCLFYPLGQFLTAARLGETNKKHPAIFLIFFQGLSITFIVQFGITYQNTQRFWLMEAWSFPLAVIGIAAFIYMLTMYFLTTRRPMH